MHPWKPRLAHVSVSGDMPQWCLDNGEGDLIPCGAGEEAEDRAKDLASALNIGVAARVRVGNDSPIFQSAQRIYGFVGAINSAIDTAFSPHNAAQNPRINEIVAAVGGLNQELVAFMNALNQPR
ncbi:MAG TPA: hypothetical protein VG328_23300 [Stellaceae bacterium]|jgi:hypothetical protein|nr:hypothetical protein [Stellaceae bacterium]